ncbi:MAG: hypothetical protein H7301_07835 [Cryobacterium sp.]|nr:hypothetical protein [Oligoflexia bacterium]
MAFGKSVFLVTGIALGLAILRTLIGPAPFPAVKKFSLASPFPKGRIVFITVDGVKEADLPEHWPRLSAEIRSQGFYYGLRSDHESMWVSNSSLRSLAGYQAIFTGHYQRTCWTNDCPRSSEKTLVDSLIDRGTLPEDVATFASWERIDRAVESNPRSVRSVAFNSVTQLSTLTSDQKLALAKIELGSSQDMPPWKNSRWDRYTLSLANTYYRFRRPKFLYVSLVDSDEYAHSGDVENYRKSLHFYEVEIMKLIHEIRSGKEGENTSFVITTDHGRGDVVFRWHGWWEPTSARIWAAVILSPILSGRGVGKLRADFYRQVDLRPTLENLLGEMPASGNAGTSLLKSQ